MYLKNAKCQSLRWDRWVLEESRFFFYDNLSPEKARRRHVRIPKVICLLDLSIFTISLKNWGQLPVPKGPFACLGHEISNEFAFQLSEWPNRSLATEISARKLHTSEARTSFPPTKSRTHHPHPPTRHDTPCVPNAAATQLRKPMHATFIRLHDPSTNQVLCQTTPTTIPHIHTHRQQYPYPNLGQTHNHNHTKVASGAGQYQAVVGTGWSLLSIAS